MFQINTRAVMVCSQAALPYLKQSANGHILNLVRALPVRLAHKNRIPAVNGYSA